MEHSFDIELATEIGVIPAILYKNILFWVIKSKANEKHFHQGKYWAYNSFPAFQKQFPYLTNDQIRYAIKKLVSDGWIETGHFSEDPRDRTCWYTITEKKSQHADFPRCIWENSQMGGGKFPHVTRASNYGPDIVTDINMNNSNELFSRKQSETDCNSGKKKSRNFQIWFDYEGDCRIHGITQEQLALWKENFPAVDVEQELRSASAWLDGNRTNRKYNVSRFLVNWLSRTQDRAKRISPQNQQVGQNVLLRDPVFAPNERGLKHDS